MDNDTDSHSPAINQANVNGKIFWDQVNGSIDINVQDQNGNENILVLGIQSDGTLGVKIVDSNGLVLFDAFQTTTVIVSDSNVSGDFTDIQTAINSVSAKGGGQVFLRNGTYLLDADIVVPDNITLNGESSGGVVLDFQGNPNQIIASGTLIDDTGTISVNNGDVAVTGVGTVFDSSMIGDSILLKGRWFTIATVTDASNLTVDAPFDGDDTSNYGTVIAVPIVNVAINNLTVQNSTHANGAIYYAYENACSMDTINIFTSTIGLNFYRSNGSSVVNFFVFVCDTGVQVTNCAVWTFDNYEIYGSTGDNLSCDGFYNHSDTNATISSAGGNNVTLVNCEAWSFLDMEVTTAGGAGISLTNCQDIEMLTMTIRENLSDGITLVSGNNRTIMVSVALIKNTGYGVNIVDSTTTNTAISASFYDSNVAGRINDHGTGTNTDNDLELLEVPENLAFSGEVVNMTYGESIVPGDLLYFKSDGSVWKANATNVTKGICMGLALETASSGSHRVLLHGIFRDDSLYSWTVGGVVYLSTTDGVGTQTQPNATDQVVQVIGVATHADRLFFNPSVDYVTHT